MSSTCIRCLIGCLVMGMGLVWPAGQSSKSPEKPAAHREGAQSEAAAQRNENVPLYQLDNNEQQELNKRVGTTPTLVTAVPVERNAYAAEFGRSPGGGPILPSSTLKQQWHGEAFWGHRNSILNARSFFQVGEVQPAHRNTASFRIGGQAGFLGDLSLELSMDKERGVVNGNVLVPLESERTPLADDPNARVLIQRFLDAYPREAPNRTDFDPRALNTNAPQTSDALTGSLRLDREITGKQKLFASYLSSRKRLEAFQLVGGQNPDTEIHGHQARLAHRTELSSGSLLVLGMDFNRTRSVLKPDSSAVGTRVRVGYQIQDLGPDSEFPIDRALNQFAWSALYSGQVSGGRHAFKVGGGFSRIQLNSDETNDARGTYSFTNQSGLTAIENLLYGLPSRYNVTIGDLYRGFRTWRGQVFAGDDWRVHPRLLLGLGVRYEFEGRPAEVRNRDVLAYSCDCNNFAPRVSLAYQFLGTSVLRAGYTLSYGEIFPVTYQQVRNNPPLVRQVMVQNPDLLDPLKGVDIASPDARYAPTLISPDLVAPYSHQYSLSVERVLKGNFLVNLGYLGSRTVKPFRVGVLNRAEIVPGIPQTPDTIDLRRPDSRYYEVYDVTNGGMAYLDAAVASLRVPSWRGLSTNVTYTFSRAIDLGMDFTSTAANKDLTQGRDQWASLSYQDRKGLSNFDSPHALLVYYAYRMPRWDSLSGVVGSVLNEWVISGTVLAKQGTPLTFFVGSDAPGFGNVDGSTGDRPNLLDDSLLGMTFGNPDTVTGLVQRGRFAYLLPGEVRGNLGRNTFRKGPIRNVNLALSRSWKLGRRVLEMLTFRLEAYNFTNTPQFDEPQRNLTSPSFGRITNTLNQGRIFQGSLRLSF